MIESKIKTMSEIFSNNYIYEIPDFQRDFVWGTKEVEQLFSDFNEDTNNFKNDISKSEGYLLGNIVLIENKKSPEKRIVIDGQQRLTTFSLLYKLLETYLFEKKMSNVSEEDVRKWTKRSSDLNKGYGILDDADEFLETKISHHISLNFGKEYKALVTNTNTNYEKDGNSSENKIKEVYETIEEKIEEFDDTQLMKFITYIKSKVMLIVTTAPNLSKAFQLFEILNNRGKDLEPLDLIKNTLLKNLNYDTDLTETERNQFNEDWKDFIDNLQISNKKRVDSSTFLKHYLIGKKGENKNKDELFQYFLDLKLNKIDVLEMVKDFKKVSKIYGKIENKKYDLMVDNKNNMTILFDLFNLKQIHSFLIPFYDESTKNKEKIVDLATRFGASVLYSFTQTNFIETIIPKHIKEYYEDISNNKDQALNNFIKGIELLIKERTELMQDQVSKRKYESRSGRYNKKGSDLIKFIELYQHNNVNIITPEKGKKLSLEHILSRTPDENDVALYGFNDIEESKNYSNRIGNLAIVYNTDNSSLSNKNFKEKRPHYEDSVFLTTKVLSSPVTTNVKKGKDTKLYETLNKYLSMDIPLDTKYWTKELINKRSINIENYLRALLENKI